jgi:hypothetical protein
MIDKYEPTFSSEKTYRFPWGLAFDEPERRPCGDR